MSLQTSNSGRYRHVGTEGLPHLAKLPVESHKSGCRLVRVIWDSVDTVWGWQEASSCLVNTISGLWCLHSDDLAFAVYFWHI